MASKTKDLVGLLPSKLFKYKESQLVRQIKKVDPQNRYVVIFPDSRNVFLGMGINLLNIKTTEQIYEKASDLAGINILKLCTKSDQGQLTKNLQNEYLAAFVTSHATMAKFGFERPHDSEFCKGAGGIGIGLLNSLVFSGAMTFENGLDLLMRYSLAMQKTADIVPNSRLIVRLKPGTNRFRVCHAAMEHCLSLGIPKEIAVCSIAGKLRTQLIIYAGHEEAIKYLEEEGYRLFDFREMRRDKRTPNAYHSQLMEPAGQFIKGYLDDKLENDPDYIKEPATSSVYSAISGRRLRFKKDIMRDLYNYPTRALDIEGMLQVMFKRPDHIAQPNIVIPWDRYLSKTLTKINRKAGTKARLLPA